MAKIADAELLDIVLQAAVRPLIQMNILETYLSPVQVPQLQKLEEKHLAKITLNLLPHGNKAVLKKELDNNVTCLLPAITYIKLKKFLNPGMQKETEEAFHIHAKLLTSRHYYSGQDRQQVKKRKSEEEEKGFKEKKKRLKRKSLKSLTAIKNWMNKKRQ